MPLGVRAVFVPELTQLRSAEDTLDRGPSLHDVEGLRRVSEVRMTPQNGEFCGARIVQT